MAIRSVVSCLVVSVLALVGCGGSGGGDDGPTLVDAGPACGNHVCESGEPQSCPRDCQTCGNGTCEGDEMSTCPADCATCGDGTCNADETAASCPTDCAVCGDGVCSSTEPSASCPGDCNATLTVVNNSIRPVWYLYVVPCGSASWGNDQLGAAIIDTGGGTFHLHGIPPGCWIWKAENQGHTWVWAQTAGVNLTAAEDFIWPLI